MSKVVLDRMPILETGKNQSGYTLFEVLAVLVLLGLFMSLAVPELLHKEEVTEIHYIQRLIDSDLKLAKAEAQSGQTIVKLEFTSHGYRLLLPEAVINRNFRKEGLILDIGGALIFWPNGKCNAMRIPWKAPHYNGDLKIDENGYSQWQKSGQK